MILVVLVAGTTFADDLYKWVDTDGNVHYSDRPISETSVDSLAVGSKLTDPLNVPAENEATVTDPEDPAPEKSPEKTVEREEKCAAVKQRLRKLLISPRLYRNDENGERVYLTDEEIIAVRERVQYQVEEYCNL